MKRFIKTLVHISLITAIVLGLGFFVLILIAYNNPRNGMRSRVSRVKSDQRDIAVALEKYCSENNVYPAWSNDLGINQFQMNALKHVSITRHPTFRLPVGIMHTLTTPVAYLTSFPPDMLSPFWTLQHDPDFHSPTYSYYAPPKGQVWILWSAGPDKDYDLTSENIAKIYDPATEQPSPALLNYVWDPSNGTISNGDVVRLQRGQL